MYQPVHVLRDIVRFETELGGTDPESNMSEHQNLLDKLRIRIDDLEENEGLLRDNLQVQNDDLEHMRGQLTDSDDDTDNELNLATKVTESTDALATVRAALEQYRDIERLHSRPQEQLGAGIVHYD